MRPIILMVLSVVAFGCSWESGGGSDLPDSGIDTNYPPPPYGSDYGDTASNFRVKECLCSGATPQSKAIYAADFLQSKATLVTVHAGWCTYCKVQAQTMTEDLWIPYKDRGLDIILVLFQDEESRSDETSLLNYCCTYREDYDMRFHVAVDPGTEQMGQFFRPTEAGTPLNMLLDSRMEIRYKMEGIIPDSRVLEGNIEGLLNE